MKKILFISFISLSLISIVSYSCTKKTKGNAKLNIRMIDAPGDFQQVNVDVQQVEVHTQNGGWVSLPTNAGIYDLLTLQNDVSASLVNQGVLPAGQMTQFRMILGPNNTVMVDSIIHDLDTPSAQQSGLKINVKTNFAPNELYEIILDFDAEKSVVKKGNGGYNLKPVLKLEAVNQL
jgi:hypothetical protein|tara:strand:- start:5309 stop:5839 length:531 start_codon:yes stop_codon:yes gene_type:complete